MQKKKVSIKDIANEAGTSITTVSFIINGKAGKKISSALIEKVLKIVEEKKYRPNPLAKSLRTGKTNTIALLVEDISNPFFSGIARLIEEKAAKKGYNIVYSSTDNDPKKTKDLIDFFQEKQVDGYIISPPENALEEIQMLCKSNTPVVLFDRYFPNASINHVVVDNFKSTQIAIEHLIKNGFKNIAFITLESNQTQMIERLEGYEYAIEQVKFKKYIYKVQYSIDNPKRMISEMTEFFKTNPSIDAVFFATNYLAILGLEVLQLINLKIGKDLGVISFDEHDLFRLYSPTITVISQPMVKIAENLINILLDELANQSDIKKTELIEIPASLIIRESSAKIF